MQIRFQSGVPLKGFQSHGVFKGVASHSATGTRVVEFCSRLGPSLRTLLRVAGASGVMISSGSHGAGSAAADDMPVLVDDVPALVRGLGGFVAGCRWADCTSTRDTGGGQTREDAKRRRLVVSSVHANFVPCWIIPLDGCESEALVSSGLAAVSACTNSTLTSGALAATAPMREFTVSNCSGFGHLAVSTRKDLLERLKQRAPPLAAAEEARWPRVRDHAVMYQGIVGHGWPQPFLEEVAGVLAALSAGDRGAFRDYFLLLDAAAPAPSTLVVL